MMLAIPAAARRKIRLAIRRQRQERLDERQTEQCQQRNGEKLSQCDVSNTRLRDG
jgi:hypothetical protein